MTEKLLPCPFCGTNAVWFKTGRDIGIECGDGFDCPGRAQTDVYGPEYRQEVVDQWNCRAAPEAAEPDSQAGLDAVVSFAIEVEKLLCAKLGREWSASGISIVSLIDQLAAAGRGA